ncbi:DUF7088 domain-containing protein [Paraflavitalea speifideaquila]|uniref:DUF7088 domain-containing protein n=1 Tax=Paraflavitalea speifideaquila TaxID=3076558 RepID=UPI0028EEF3D3|nr:Gldg family protein [Paraflavitalea speifideiaquila]
MRELGDQVTVTVLLEGDMPAGFKRLSNSARELLQEFKETGKANIQYRFQRPGMDPADSTGAFSMDSLMRMGLKPTNVRVKAREGEGKNSAIFSPVLWSPFMTA